MNKKVLVILMSCAVILAIAAVFVYVRQTNTYEQALHREQKGADSVIPMFKLNRESLVFTFRGDGEITVAFLEKGVLGWKSVHLDNIVLEEDAESFYGPYVRKIGEAETIYGIANKGDLASVLVDGRDAAAVTPASFYLDAEKYPNLKFWHTIIYKRQSQEHEIQYLNLRGKDIGPEAFPEIVQNSILEALNKSNGVLEKGDLSKVEYLHIQGNGDNAVDLASLKRLPNLKGLELSYVSVPDYDFLYNLPKLGALEINGVDRERLPDFSKLHLTSIRLHDGNIANLDFLSENRELTAISATSCQLKNIDGLKNAGNLVALQLSENPISDDDLQLIKNFSKLQRLEVRSTSVTNLSALANSSQLRMLDIRDTSVSSVQAIAKLPNLQILLALKDNLTDRDQLPDTVLVSERNVLAY